LSKKWYSGGNLEDEVNYNKGYKDGCHKYYYENGQLSAEEYYKGGGKFNLDFFGECYGSYYNGTSKYWDENGQLFREHNYKDNQLISGRCWDETGIEIDYFSIDLDDIDYKGLADAYWEDVDDIIKKSD
jgi:antitoxin component YwqK of YwqJK toxin-antitoxin module